MKLDNLFDLTSLEDFPLLKSAMDAYLARDREIIIRPELRALDGYSGYTKLVMADSEGISDLSQRAVHEIIYPEGYESEFYGSLHNLTPQGLEVVALFASLAQGFFGGDWGDDGYGIMHKADYYPSWEEDLMTVHEIIWKACDDAGVGFRVERA